ncbi:DUF1187 family protein, partial [Escherichia coli]|nr:DUF1187 family protein [Escherichia coli]
ATIEKEGGTPTNWIRYSKSKLTKSECVLAPLFPDRGCILS